jgi:drug/metabolite transporter (DMT)-like permease
MIYIILTVCISVSLLVVFKIFDNLKVNTLNAIVFNYAFAALTGIIIHFSETHHLLFFKLDALVLILPLGILFIAVFYAISQTAQKISISIASVANKMSVILPVLFSVMVLNEELSVLKLIGIILALISVVFTMYRKQQKHQKFSWYLPLLVFLGSGIIDIGMNYANNSVIRNNEDTLLFSSSVFMCAFCFGVLFKFLNRPTTKNNSKAKINITTKDIIGGLILGVPNYFSIYFMLKALNSGVMKSALLFPVLNVSNVLLTALIGLLYTKNILQK